MPTLKFKRRVAQPTVQVVQPPVVVSELLTKTTAKEKSESILEKVTSFSVPTVEGIQRLFEASNDIQGKCRDYLIDDVSEVRTSYRKTDGFDELTVPELYFPTSDITRDTQVMSDFAFSQLCGKLQVPVRYMQKCLAENPDLMVNNLDSWLSSYGHDLFIRSYNNSIRGILSSRYSVFDTPDILDVVSDVTRAYGLRVKSYFMSPERFHARMITSEPLAIPDEDLFAGIQIDSSDVGRSVLKVMFFIYKQVCTNGLCIERGHYDLYTQKHLKICTDDFREGLVSSLKVFPELVEEMTNFIEQSKGNNSFLANTSWREPDSYEKAIEHLVERIRTGTNISEESAKKVITLLDTYGKSDWGVVNALTEVAQDYTLEKRIEIEKFAGRMLLRSVA